MPFALAGAATMSRAAPSIVAVRILRPISTSSADLAPPTPPPSARFRSVHGSGYPKGHLLAAPALQADRGPAVAPHQRVPGEADAVREVTPVPVDELELVRIPRDPE